MCVCVLLSFSHGSVIFSFQLMTFKFMTRSVVCLVFHASIDMHVSVILTDLCVRVTCRYPADGPLPVGRSLHTLTAVSENTLFLFGGLSATGQPLSKFKGRCHRSTRMFVFP